MSICKDELLSKLTIVDDLDGAIINLLSADKIISVGFFNQHAYNMVSADPDVKRNFFSLDYLFKDGKGVELACQYNNMPSGLNLNGTDFIPSIINKIISSKNNYSFFSYGTVSPWLEFGSDELFNGEPYIALDGFKSKEDYLRSFKKNNNSDCFNVIILAMGMPKQELVASYLKEKITGRGIIICGGAILDFQAGRISRSPSIMRRLGLEWSFDFRAQEAF
jgi:beta-1,4-glucosyltransferase